MHYTGNGMLGKGANGEVWLAEIIGPDGRCGKMVACKSATGRERESLRKEAGMIPRLPVETMFPSVRAAYPGKSNVLVLQDLALGGTSGALHRRLERSGNLDSREKTRATRLEGTRRPCREFTHGFIDHPGTAMPAECAE